MSGMAGRIAGKLNIGTSGWSYRHWRGLFYPERLSSREWLPFYAQHFATVEVNNSFYRLPTRETFEQWARVSPDRFVFAIKASRYITHVKKLRDAGDAVTRLLENAGGLGTKLGPVLFQLPARWHANLERLDDFAASLPPGYRYAFEFRDESWLTDDVFNLLKRRGLALCISDAAGWRTALEATAPFVFIRLHGGRVLPGSAYSGDELNRWAWVIEGFLERRLDVFAYFNNDARAHAVSNALRLKELLAA